MSSAKFASITAGLLARKGEAQPWAQEEGKVALAWRNEPLAAAAAPPPLPPKEKSCAVRMSAQDYERLGILAVKSAMTRQQLLKAALAQFLDSKARDYACACLGSCQRGCSPAD